MEIDSQHLLPTASLCMALAHSLALIPFLPAVNQPREEKGHSENWFGVDYRKKILSQVRYRFQIRGLIVSDLINN